MKQRSLKKNALLNGIKQGCSIFFPFISFTYCSRVLGADSLGIYSFGQSIIAYLLLLSTLGIPNYAIREGAMLREDYLKLQKFVNEVFTINFVMTIISYALLAAMLLLFNSLEDYKVIIAIQSLQILLTFVGADWINSIFEDYFYLALRYIIIQVIAIVALLIFVNAPKDIYIYTAITMLSNSGGNILNCFYLRKKEIYPTLTIHWSLKKHILPILILFCNSIATVIYLNSDVTMLGIFTSASKVGIYTVSSKIYTLLKTMINAIVMVTVPRFSAYIANHEFDKYKKALKNVSEILFLVVVPMIIGMVLEADKILQLIAGREYLSGTSVVRILSIGMFFAVGACYFSYSYLIPNKKEKHFLISTVSAALINITLNLVFIPTWEIKGAAFTTLVAECVVFIMSGYFSMKITKIEFQVVNIISVLMGGIGVVCACLLVDWLINDWFWALIIDVIVSVLVYSVVLIRAKNIYVLNAVKIAKKSIGK